MTGADLSLVADKEIILRCLHKVTIPSPLILSVSANTVSSLLTILQYQGMAMDALLLSIPFVDSWFDSGVKHIQNLHSSYWSSSVYVSISISTTSRSSSVCSSCTSSSTAAAALGADAVKSSSPIFQVGQRTQLTTQSDCSDQFCAQQIWFSLSLHCRQNCWNTVLCFANN